jgi:hypothetical protein
MNFIRKVVLQSTLLLLFLCSLNSVHAQTVPVPFPSTVPWQKTQILTPNPSEQAFSEPSVLYENGTWRMWYRVGWSNPQGIFYATSTDALNWTKHGRVTNGYNAHVIRYNSTTLLLYAHGLVNQYSADGIHWYKFNEQHGLSPNSWLNQTDPYPNEQGTIGNSEPVKLPNGTYLMYSDARNCNEQGMNPTGQSCQASDFLWGVIEATSDDGINSWVRAPGNPILGGIVNGYAAANPNVIYQNGVYYAFIDVTYYIGATYIVETLATSTDGLNFTYAYVPSRPVLGIDVEKEADPQCNQVGDAWVVVRPNGIYLFYDEDANVAGSTITHASIWLAFLPNTTLAQLAAGQFGANTSQETTTTFSNQKTSVPEFPSTILVISLGTSSVFVTLHSLTGRRRRRN